MIYGATAGGATSLYGPGAPVWAGQNAGAEAGGGQPAAATLYPFLHRRCRIHPQPTADLSKAIEIG